MIQNSYVVYVKVNSKSQIVEVNSSAFLENVAGWVEIDEGTGDRYRHAQGNYLPGALYTKDGIPRYKLVDGQPVERTEEEIQADRLPGAKVARIAKSKADLADYLASHPLTWTDGNQYSITQEKQAQLTSTLVSAQVDGEPPEWNTTGGQCREWKLEELAALGVAIKRRVKALVKYQQGQEIAMNAATTMEELERVVVDYDSVV